MRIPLPHRVGMSGVRLHAGTPCTAAWTSAGSHLLQLFLGGERAYTGPDCIYRPVKKFKSVAMEPMGILTGDDRNAPGNVDSMDRSPQCFYSLICCHKLEYGHERPRHTAQREADDHHQFGSLRPAPSQVIATLTVTRCAQQRENQSYYTACKAAAQQHRHIPSKVCRGLLGHDRHGMSIR